VQVALYYAQRDLQESLSETFCVEEIPTLVLADPKTGKLSVDGMAKVAPGTAAFPWPLCIEVFSDTVCCITTTATNLCLLVK
jgi:hypothetical protein